MCNSESRRRQFLDGTRLLGLLAINGIEERQDSGETADKLPLGFFGHFLGESIARCSEYRLNHIPNPLGDLELVCNYSLGIRSRQRKPFIRLFLPKTFRFLSCVTSRLLHSATTLLRVTIHQSNPNRAKP